MTATSVKIHKYKKLDKVAIRLRDDLSNLENNVVLIYAFNGTGKTRLSMEFKERGKKKNRNNPDTLYFNAFTEDLFYWDNDLENDSIRVLKMNSTSKFFNGFKELSLESKIGVFLERYVEFIFDIDYETWTIKFRKGDSENIKISRGEEVIFIWCIYLAICELTLDNENSYGWVKYFYIDDPISSLDENNAIAVASDLAQILKKASDRVIEKVNNGVIEKVNAPIKAVVSTHHVLFFNVMCNELRGFNHKQFFFHKNRDLGYTLRATNDTPFYHHVASLSELKVAADSGNIKTHHFNTLRSILEKTSAFFGYNDFSQCIHGIDDQVLYERALNLLSHGKYSVYEPVNMNEDNKQLFERILNAFLIKYKFDLPTIFN